MSTSIKVVVYVVLIACAVFFGLSFRYAYQIHAQGGAPALTEQAPMGTYLASALGCLIALGLMVAKDVANFFGERAVDFVFADEGDGIRNPEYEEAEEVWKSGEHLEAIRMLRDYYKKNPREVHVLLRIAEIYENNLANPLAAVLEYEEVLKLKLPPERWGWSAIHLCNLYNKLNQAEKANTLLYRIAEDYGQTAAAKKARERLGIAEPTPAPVVPVEEAAPAPVEASEPVNKLPPGFSPKKR
ncbi:MAG: hypothetical protein WCO56_01475 [Verrucomicrobiota bacterium]